MGGIILKNVQISKLYKAYLQTSAQVRSKISIFDQNFNFRQTFRFLTEITILTKISILDQHFDFFPNF